jgi:hypothetical protein
MIPNNNTKVLNNQRLFLMELGTYQRKNYCPTLYKIGNT